MFFNFSHGDFSSKVESANARVYLARPKGTSSLGERSEYGDASDGELSEGLY